MRGGYDSVVLHASCIHSGQFVNIKHILSVNVFCVNVSVSGHMLSVHSSLSLNWP